MLRKNTRHDLAETKGDDGEVVTPQAQRWCAQERAGAGGDEHADQQRDPEGDVDRVMNRRADELLGGEHAIGVRADREEGGITEVQQPREADHHVETDRQEDVNAGVCGEADQVISVPVVRELDDGREGKGADAHHRVRDRVRVPGILAKKLASSDHFSGTRMPSSPVGLNTRVAIRIPKMRTSVQDESK